MCGATVKVMYRMTTPYFLNFDEFYISGLVHRPKDDTQIPLTNNPALQIPHPRSLCAFQPRNEERLLRIQQSCILNQMTNRKWLAAADVQRFLQMWAESLEPTLIIDQITKEITKRHAMKPR